MEDPGKNYNPKQSQFWRVTNAIAQTISPNKNLAECITYTNLYKLAHSSRNPSQKLMYAIDKMCIEIFKAEVEYYKPKYILFLTGWGIGQSRSCAVTMQTLILIISMFKRKAPLTVFRL
jgi:hypothetical protein